MRATGAEPPPAGPCAPSVAVECSLGEVVDKVTILRLKAKRIHGDQAAARIRAELHALVQAWRAAALPEMESLAEWRALGDVNRRLWDVEDRLRECEARDDFGPEFVRHARAVYRLNDRRAGLKRRISEALGSRLVEEKQYAGAPRPAVAERSVER